GRRAGRGAAAGSVVLLGVRRQGRLGPAAKLVLGVVVPGGAVVRRRAAGDRRRALVGRADVGAVVGEQVATQVVRRAAGVGRDFARVPLGRVDQHFQHAGLAVQADDVAVADLADRTAARRLRGDVDRRGDLARRAGQAAVGDQRHLAALVL